MKQENSTIKNEVQWVHTIGAQMQELKNPLIIFLCIFGIAVPNLAYSQKSKRQTPQMQEFSEAIWVAYVFRRQNSQTKIDNMAFPFTRLPVYLVPHGQLVRPLVKLKMKYLLPNGWKLFANGNEIVPENPSTPEGYLIYAYLNSTINDIKITVFDESGHIRGNEDIYLFAPEARGLQMTSPFKSVYFKFGTSWMYYGQSSFGTFSANALALGLQYRSPERGQTWGLLGDFDLTAFTYDSSPPDLNPQFYKAHASITKMSKIIPSPLWRARWIGGIRTIGVFDHGSPFGFSGLFGPNFGYRSEYYLNNTSSLAFDAFYTLYSSEALLFAEDRTFDLELSFNYRMQNLTQLIYGVSYSNSSILVNGENIDLELLLFTFSFSL